MQCNKDFFPIYNGGLCPPNPLGFDALWTKACKRDDALHTVPMLQTPTAALGLLPSRALSSELASIEYQGYAKRQLNKKSMILMQMILW